MKKKLLSLMLSVTLILPVLPPMAGAANDFLDSGDISMEKLTKAEITDLLNENSLDLPSVVLEEELSVTAPYAQGKVSDEALDAAINRLNALRRIAGLPDVELDAELCELSQYGAAIEAINDELTHFPTQPADMDDTFFQNAYASTSHSSISEGDILPEAVDSLMDDSDRSNVEEPGHRLWQLNPKMGKTGFGYAGSPTPYSYGYTTEYTFDQSGSGCDFDFIGWPASGYFPNNLTAFNRHSAWTVSLDPNKYAAPSGITVTITCESDGQNWMLSGAYPASDSGKYLNVIPADGWNYGNTHCIVFRPDGIQKYEGVYTVEIDGLKTKSGSNADFAYQVEFFDPENPSKQPEQTEIPDQPDSTDRFPVNTTGLHSFGAGLAIKSDGTLVNWGTRYLSGSTDTGFSMGHPWSGGETKLDRKYTSISVCGDNPSAAGITEDGTAEIWGALFEMSEIANCYHSVPVEHLKDAKQAFRSITTSIYLKDDGTVWRSNRGRPTIEAPEHIFKEFSDVIQVANGWEVCYALREDGSLWSYGSGYHCESGVEDSVDFQDENEWDKPHKILDDVSYVTAGMYNAMAVKKDGSLWGWGYCGGYSLGNGGAYDVDKSLAGPCVITPVKIMDNVAIVSTTGNFGGAVTTDGKLYTWGMNGDGQLGFSGGNASYESGGNVIPAQSTPKYVTDDVVDIACGLGVMIIQKRDGSLWASGSNERNLTSSDADGRFVKVMDDVKLMADASSDTTPPKPQEPEKPSTGLQVNTTGLHTFGAGLAIKQDGTMVS